MTGQRFTAGQGGHWHSSQQTVFLLSLASNSKSLNLNHNHFLVAENLPMKPGPKPRPMEIRFWSKVEKTEGCWNWKGYTHHGYGRFYFEGKSTSAHRISYELAKGPMPKGKQTDHLCRNRACVNPDHLEAVSQRTNQLRGQTISAMNLAKTHCPRGHSLIMGNLVPSRLKHGWRICVTCRKAKQKEYGKAKEETHESRKR